TIKHEDSEGYSLWLAGESQALENSNIDGIDETLLCQEIFDSSSLSNNAGLNYASCTGTPHNTNEMIGNNNASFGIADLENLELDTP
ncbi:hypothetical protein, partial [Klebsiella pneumoniae]